MGDGVFLRNAEFERWRGANFLWLEDDGVGLWLEGCGLVVGRRVGLGFKQVDL